MTALGDRFHQLRERLRDKATRARRSLVMHAVSFAGVNGLLLFINLVTGGGTPWFLIPSAFNAAAVIQHAVHAANHRRAADELDAAGYLDEGRLKLVRDIQQERASFRLHGAFAASMSGALFMLNVVTGGDTPWFLIPSAALGAAAVIHAVVSFNRRASLTGQLSRSGIDWRKIADAATPASARRRALTQRTAGARPAR